MIIKKVIKKTFEEEFNKEKMREEILLKAESKRHLSLNILFKFAIPICVFTLVVLTFSNNHNKMSDKVYINELKNRTDISRMSNVTEKNNVDISDFKILDKKVMPSDFKEEKYRKAYTGNIQEEIDANYIFTSIGNNGRYLEISFGKNRDLSKNYAAEMTIKKSKINDIEMVLYQYDTFYIGTYFYQDYYFDVQTYNMTEEEFINLLKSITRKNK